MMRWGCNRRDVNTIKTITKYCTLATNPIVDKIRPILSTPFEMNPLNRDLPDKKLMCAFSWAIFYAMNNVYRKKEKAKHVHPEVFPIRKPIPLFPHQSPLLRSDEPVLLLLQFS